jgi:hypothetical protein
MSGLADAGLDLTVDSRFFRKRANGEIRQRMILMKTVTSGKIIGENATAAMVSGDRPTRS